MSNTDKLREIAEKWARPINSPHDDEEATQEVLSDLTALISEHYVERAKYDEAVRQRDELRERCKRLETMIDLGLGWDDVMNDISMPHEL